MSIIAGPKIIEDGLILYLDASNNKSYPGTGNTWVDLSGQNLNLTLNNSPSYDSSGAVSSFTFDGVDDFAEKSGTNILNQSDYVTFMTFFKLNTGLSQGRYGLFMGTGGPSGYLSLFVWNSNNFLFESRETVGSVYRGVSQTPSISPYLGNWYFVGFRVDNVNQTLSIFTHTSTLNVSTVSDTRNQKWTINRVRAGIDASGFRLPGKQATYMLYNTALTDSQIKQNFEAMRGRYGI